MGEGEGGGIKFRDQDIVQRICRPQSSAVRSENI